MPTTIEQTDQTDQTPRPTPLFGDPITYALAHSDPGMVARLERARELTSREIIARVYVAECRRAVEVARVRARNI